MITQSCIPCDLLHSLMMNLRSQISIYFSVFLCFFTAFIVKNDFPLGDAWRKLVFVHLKFNQRDSYLLYFDDKNWETISGQMYMSFN